MRLQYSISAVLMLAITVAGAQVATPAPAATKPDLAPMAAHAPGDPVSGKAVARVNGAVLTDRDLLREMYAIFPYARQHNGFPQGMEAEIRKGALEMIIFDELVYQEAVRRNMAVTPARISRAEAEFRKQFPSPDVYKQYMQIECKGSPRVLRQRMRRSLLIEDLLKADVQTKSAVSVAEAKAYYEKNPQQFKHDERFSIQTISIIPPQNASADVQKEARKRAEDALKQAKATKNYREFGLLAEKISDDDWHVNMGDRKQVDRAKLPPPVVEAALKMKAGEVSDLIQLGPNYTLFRLNGHTPAGKVEFATVRTKLASELQKAKYDRLRAELHKKLRKNAKIEVL